MSNGLIYRQASVHTSQLRRLVSRSAHGSLMLGIYYMKVFARSAAFLTPELIRTRFNWRLNAALPGHRTRNSFASSGVEKSSSELPLTKSAGQADAAVVRLQRTLGLGTRRGAAGRGRPPQAAARRAGLEDVEKLLTSIIDCLGMARRGSRRGLLGQDRFGELIGHGIHEHLVVALTVGDNGSSPPADLPESCLAVGPDGGEVP